MARKIKHEASDLRRQAVKAIAEKKINPEEIPSGDLQKLVTELSIYQTELEIQNENLQQTHRTLEESRSKYADLYDFAPIGYFTFDPAGLILEVNLTGSALLEIERRRLKRTPFSAYVAAGSGPVFRSHLERVVKTGQKDACELMLARTKVVNKTALPIFIRLESIARPGEGSDKLTVRSVVTDISDQKKIERELHAAHVLMEETVRERTSELQEAVRDLEAFTYSVSHDIRSPLRAIQGFARMIEQEYGEKLDGELLRKFKVIEDNAARMGRLIDALLELSRLGRKDLRLVPIDMNRVAADVVKEIQESEPDRVKIDLKEMPPACGDPGLVHQVVYNLLSNAVKFTRKRKAPLITIEGKRDGKFSTYEVKDNGAGFNMAYYDKLFGVFQRLHGAEYGGTGIGLAIVRRVVEKHGGKVWADGAEGKGASFFFSLPYEIPSDRAFKMDEKRAGRK